MLVEVHIATEYYPFGQWVPYIVRLAGELLSYDDLGFSTIFQYSKCMQRQNILTQTVKDAKETKIRCVTDP